MKIESITSPSTLLLQLAKLIPHNITQLQSNMLNFLFAPKKKSNMLNGRQFWGLKNLNEKLKNWACHAGNQCSKKKIPNLIFQRSKLIPNVHQCSDNIAPIIILQRKADIFIKEWNPSIWNTQQDANDLKCQHDETLQQCSKSTKEELILYQMIVTCKSFHIYVHFFL